jgi:hypothetical protein
LDSYAKHLATAPPGVVLVTDSDDPEFATYDEGRLAERIMLAAHGLGSCIGWWTMAACDEAKALLGVPADRIVRTVLGIGAIDEETRRARPRRTHPRKEMAAFVHQDRFA